MVKYNRAQRDGLVPLHVVLEILGRATTIEEARENMALATEPKLITVKEAAAKHGIPSDRLHRWIQRGHLSRHGLQYNPLGAAHVQVDENELIALLENPPKNGRPSKC